MLQFARLCVICITVAKVLSWNARGEPAQAEQNACISRVVGETSGRTAYAHAGPTICAVNDDVVRLLTYCGEHILHAEQ